MSLSPAMLSLNIDPLLRLALTEDIACGDISTDAVMPHAARGDVQLIAKQDGVLCGLEVFERTFWLLDPTVTVEAHAQDGDEVKAGQVIARVEADVRALLSGERVALNYLQRMSGIATYTRSMVQVLEGTSTRLADTRKTAPNMRVFEKYAARVGGAVNHRLGLTDGVMLKDNHIDAAGSLTAAVAAARAQAPFVRMIEVECETLEMVSDALDAGADIIMLDNMDHATMAAAVQLIDGRAITEASGNVDAENLIAYADLGVDIVSSGAITHSAPILDLSLKHLRVFDADTQGN